jgi:hypothetical protein
MDRSRHGRGIARQYAAPRPKITEAYLHLPDLLHRGLGRRLGSQPVRNAEGESLVAAALGQASGIMMAHPLALQLRNLQSLVETAATANGTAVS